MARNLPFGARWSAIAARRVRQHLVAMRSHACSILGCVWWHWMAVCARDAGCPAPAPPDATPLMPRSCQVFFDIEIDGKAAGRIVMGL